MKTIYMICGEPGVGKTTTAVALTADASLVFEADKFPKWWESGSYQWQRELAGESHKWCQSQVETAMKNGLHPLAVSNNAVDSRGWRPYIKLALKHNYNVQIISCDGVILADGSIPNNVHGLNAGIVLSRRAAKKRYVPESKIFWDKYHQQDDSLPTLYIFDRDKTLVRGEVNEIPSIKKSFIPIAEVVAKIIELKKNGHIITIASNQAGISFNSSGGSPHKTENELLEECRLIQNWIEPDTQLYCPDINGEQCWQFESNRFIKHNQSDYEWIQPFRKPAGGMLEFIMHKYQGKYGNIVVVGDDRKDELASQSVGANFTHVWDF